mmetsp:Transcript_2905/g.6498  ORF Transcript_2905/g.6498 Transcript_2905/m.6498 type:complete len:215 (+) Transcript_2905:368-1012(+)
MTARARAYTSTQAASQASALISAGLAAPGCPVARSSFCWRATQALTSGSPPSGPAERPSSGSPKEPGSCTNWTPPAPSSLRFKDLVKLRYRSRASFCIRMRLSPSANLQHCKKSRCLKPASSMRAKDPTSCFRRKQRSIDSSTAATFAVAMASTSSRLGSSPLVRHSLSSTSHRLTKASTSSSFKACSAYRALSWGMSDSVRSRPCPGIALASL